MCAKRRAKNAHTRRLPSCPPPDTLRLLYLGRLSRHELESVEDHVCTCSACAAALGRIHEADPLLEAMRAQPTVATRLAVYRAEAASIVERLKSEKKRFGL